MAFMSAEELSQLGLAECGPNVLISTRASIYGAERIRIGSNVRIDDFCIISAGDGGIAIGSHVHIAAYASIIGAGRVTIEDFAGVSSRATVYSSTDDFSGRSMTGPTVPSDLRAVDSRPVHVGRHVVIGSGSVVLPGVTINQGAAIGALSLVKEDCDAFTIYGGKPARPLGPRSDALLALELELAKSQLRPA